MKLKYELALHLKNEGFPQTIRSDGSACGYPEGHSDECVTAPTLSELINECVALSKYPFKLYCNLPGKLYGYAFEGGVSEGPWQSAEETMANCWLALKKN